MGNSLKRLGRIAPNYEGDLDATVKSPEVECNRVRMDVRREASNSTSDEMFGISTYDLSVT
jgi:hypothetical protein